MDIFGDVFVYVIVDLFPTIQVSLRKIIVDPVTGKKPLLAFFINNW